MIQTTYIQWLATVGLTVGTGAIALFPLPGIADDTPTPPPQPGITRPSDAACLITPVADGVEVAQVWSDRPFFLWKNYPRGAMRTVEVQSRDAQFISFTYTLFRATVSGETQISYVGTSLERGQVYQWVAYSDTMSAAQVIPFEVMSDDEYEQVAIELEAAEQEWQTAGLLPEEQVLERITFFAERGLWSDAMRVAFTVPNPSEELLDYQELVMLSACSG
ncbi:hypothetical protein [Leptolyngbya sp. CCY15150]|uniref:hypothetical protein n=1 Tax=Leptolyngbya sp. CCY15150 TaxID=2767772 RepID=UPI001950A152|nr:hypothetical protein [Leptolyngbya sp. CCY15150]